MGYRPPRRRLSPTEEFRRCLSATDESGARAFAAAGKPWKTWFAPSELDRELRALGFSEIEDLDSAALNLRYFGGREKRLGGRSVGRIVTAFR